MDPRVSHRIPIHYPIVFLGDNFTGEGTVVDISEEGCAVGSAAGEPPWLSNLSTGGCKVASSTPADRGTYLELRIFLTHDPKSPMKVDLAAVRWAQEQEFGLEFITVRPEEQERLHRFVSTLETGLSH